jgi:hypothetical protein
VSVAFFIEDEGSDMEVDDMSDSENDLGQEKKVLFNN